MPARSICKILAAVLLATGPGYLGSRAARAGDHPSLLITPADVSRLRHACGVGQPAEATEAAGKFGRHAADFQAVRHHLARPMPGAPLAR